MRPLLRISLVAALAAAPLTIGAQRVERFADLPLRVDRHDRVQVIDANGASASGTLGTWSKGSLTLQTDAGERRFDAASVRQFAREGRATKRYAYIGAGVFAAMGALACGAHHSNGCEAWPVLDAVLFGAPLGAMIGAWVPRMQVVYQAPTAAAGASSPPTAANAAPPGLLETLGMRINLDDRVTVERRDGARVAGRVTGMTDDALLVTERPNTEEQVAVADIRRVTRITSKARLGTLAGFLVGSALCAPGAGNELIDAFLMCGGLGAGAGALIGAGIHVNTAVYPETEVRLTLAPSVDRGRFAVRANYRF